MSWFAHHTQTPHPIQTEAEVFWYLNLTHDQQTAYEKLLEHLRQAGQLLQGHDDRYTLLRFLKARQWDVHRAAVMYQSMVKWRHEYQTDKVYETFTFPEKDAVLKHYPHFFHNTDKYGRPLYVELLGLTDAAKILEATTLERLVEYHVCYWENLKRKILPACTALAGRPIIAKTVILDLKGVSMKTFGTAAQKILRTVVHIDQDYYCESLGQMFLINTPTVFRLIWAMVNPLLEERTRRKIVILGADYLPTITQLVPPDKLPTCLGGRSHQPDHKTSIGPWSDEHVAEGLAIYASHPGTMADAKGAQHQQQQQQHPSGAQDGGDGEGQGDHKHPSVALTAEAGVSQLRPSATAPGRIEGMAPGELLAE